MLVALGGLPAVGKSVLAKSLARRIGAVHLRIDTDFDAIRGGMAQRKMGAMIETLGQKHGVTIKTDVARLPEAQFSLDAKGQGTLQVPKGSAFRDLNHQVSSVMQAVAHSTLAREAQRQVAAAPADQPHEAAAARVAGYQQSPSKQAKSPAFAEADLVASYAALHETTGLGLDYNPSPNVSNVEMQERWAQKLAEPVLTPSLPHCPGRDSRPGLFLVRPFAWPPHDGPTGTENPSGVDGVGL